MSRRAALRGAAGGLVALPLLEAMGGAAARPRRFIAVVTPNGTIPEHFWPTPPGSSPYPRTKPTMGPYWTSPRPAVDTDGHEMAWITEPLAPHKASVSFVEGVDLRGSEGHPAAASVLGGYEIEDKGESAVSSLGPSVDQVVATQVGGATRIPSLQLGVMTDPNHFGIVSFYGARKRAVAEVSPPAVFAKLFSGAASGDAVARAQLARLYADRRSVLDATKGQALALSRRLGAQDRAKLDNYLEGLRAVEKQLTEADDDSACATPTSPGSAGEWWMSTNEMPRTTKTQIDLLVAALACDVTRVATLQIAMEQSYYAMPFLGIDGAFHELSHRGDEDIAAMTDLVRIDRWHAEQVAYLLTRLAATPEGDGSLLDSTVVLWTNAMSKGNLHSSVNLPVVVAGGAGGVLRRGRYLRLGKRRTVNDLHFELAKAVGVSTASMGDPAFFTGGIPELRV